ncbi:PatB family C-S lyase [Paenibacillus dokdonensis]|uniref:cysteine-S-conjugate beta-lyase n=1 Tax=Paenibacillus dokdonensis TaxID=2567944 RepID=A0ABU6GU56_9BACL|nr:PatB family C-S lyase [Paenibacillus dokdonensis]MEC0241856.1 PatB family C-S lyase [Paenibacillus dokdonensis]
MNFDKIITRNLTGSDKWDGMKNIFGTADALPMWVADMDFESPPSVIAAMQKRVEHGVFGYTMQTDEYKQSIVNWMKQRHDWEIDPEWLVFCPGVVPALSFAIQAFTEPGDKVVIQPPVYPPFHSVVKDHGRELVLNPLKSENGHYSMDLEALEQILDSQQVKMLILCSPHNPVGRIWSSEELEALVQLCTRHDVLIISDEIHADLIYEKNAHIPLAKLSDEAKSRSIICTAPSKTFNIAGLNTSNIIIPDPEIRSIFMKALQLYHVGSISAIGSTAAEAAYTDGGEWLDEVLTYLQLNIDYVVEYIGKHIPEIKVQKPEATYLLWLDFSSLGMTPNELEAFLLTKAKLALNKGSAFGQGGAEFMRMNIACPMATVVEAMKRLDAALTEWRLEQKNA